ncbi:MAG: hypothetical protein WAO12_02400 [Venatoribacter sp.]
MKKLILITALLSLVGCAATPPKASVIVNNDSDIVISTNSSEALKELNALGFKGVRDLTSSEFKRNKKDADLFEKYTGSKDGFNRLAYEAGGVGLGLAAGLSMGTVLGYGALTALTADDRPDNYHFAWDFDGRIMVVSKKGKVDDNKLNDAIFNVLEQLPSIYPSIFTKDARDMDGRNANGLSERIKRSEYNNKRKIKVVVEPVPYFFGVRYAKTHAVFARSYCSPSVDKCEVLMNFADVRKVGSQLAQSNLLLRLVATELDEDHFVYLPPGKSMYRLPMIIRGGTGEIEYLVEKTNP